MLDRYTSVVLIEKELTADSIGVKRAKEKRKKVYAEVSSSSQSEFFKAAQTGLKPAMTIIIWDFEYNNETDIEVYGERYSIYRTFNQKHSGKIELYIEKRSGNV